MTSRTMWLSICATLLVSTAIVMGLFLMSADLRRRQGSFIREFPPHAIEESDTLHLTYSTYYLAGATDHTLYLANYEKPLHMISVDLGSLDTTHVTLSVKGLMEQKFWSPRVKVDSPDFYFVDGAVSRIYRGKVGAWTATRYPHDSGYYFNDVIPINPDSYILKTISPHSLENVLGRLQSESPRYRYNDSILEKQVDGRFCTEGMLHYNPGRVEILYLYRYRNEFVVMDTMLCLKYRGRTIDTTAVAQIKVADLAQAQQRVLSSPATDVNAGSAVWGNFMIVRSPTLASNEPEDALREATVMDVYNLVDRRYLFSFYVYHYRHHKPVEQFTIAGNKLIVLFEGVIVSFQIRERYLAGVASD